MAVRKSVPADAEAIHAIDRVAWDVTSTPAELPLDGHVHEPENTWVYDDGTVVGYAFVGLDTPLPSSAHARQLRAVAVHPSRRGEGLGAILMRAVLDDLESAGVTLVTLQALGTNTGAHRVYTQAGFREIGRVRGRFLLPGASGVEPVDDLLFGVHLGRHEGGCHCGAVRFSVRIHDRSALECNCSVCTRKGFLHVIVPEQDFQLLQGREALSTYTFGTHTAQHHFCSTCGMHAFYRPRSHPEHWDVNARCLDAGHEAFEIRPFDGRNWEQARETLG